MVYEEIPPPLNLSAYVRHFWFIRHNTHNDQMYNFRLMADGFPSLIFQYQNQFKDYLNNSHTFPHILLLGHTNTFRTICIQGEFHVFGVSFFPYTLKLLFDISSSDIKNNVVDAQSVFAPDWQLIPEQLASAKDHSERKKILSTFLMRKLNRGQVTDPIVERAVQHIIQVGGVCTIENLTKQFSISRRQFERRFYEAVGFSAKHYATIIRFQCTLKYDPAHAVKSLTEHALSGGYADQAHFIRDIKNFSGITPTQYFSRHSQAAENLIEL